MVRSKSRILALYQYLDTCIMFQVELTCILRYMYTVPGRADLYTQIHVYCSR